MPAHSKPLNLLQCTTQGCDKPAARMVYNRSGEAMRACCADHARVLVKFLNGLRESVTR